MYIANYVVLFKNKLYLLLFLIHWATMVYFLPLFYPDHPHICKTVIQLREYVWKCLNWCLKIKKCVGDELWKVNRPHAENQKALNSPTLHKAVVEWQTRGRNKNSSNFWATRMNKLTCLAEYVLKHEDSTHYYARKKRASALFYCICTQTHI